MAQALPYIYYAVAAAGAVAQASSMEDAEDAQHKANQERRSIQRAQALQQRRQQVRQARQARAAAVNQAFISGGEGTKLQGALGSISQQQGQNLGFLESTGARAENAFRADQSASSKMFQSQVFGQISGLALQAATSGLGQSSTGLQGANKSTTKLIDTSGLYA